MRSPFDDAFYCVDKCTLDEVEEAMKRVVAIESVLDLLAKGCRMSRTEPQEWSR